MYLVNLNQSRFVVSDTSYPKLESFNPIALDDLKKKNPMELIFTADAVDYLNNYCYLTIVDGEWKTLRGGL